MSKRVVGHPLPKSLHQAMKWKPSGYADRYAVNIHCALSVLEPEPAWLFAAFSISTA